MAATRGAGESKWFRPATTRLVGALLAVAALVCLVLADTTSKKNGAATGVVLVILAAISGALSFRFVSSGVCARGDGALLRNLFSSTLVSWDEIDHFQSPEQFTASSRRGVLRAVLANGTEVKASVFKNTRNARWGAEGRAVAEQLNAFLNLRRTDAGEVKVAHAETPTPPAGDLRRNVFVSLSGILLIVAASAPFWTQQLQRNERARETRVANEGTYEVETATGGLIRVSRGTDGDNDTIASSDFSRVLPIVDHLRADHSNTFDYVRVGSAIEILDGKWRTGTKVHWAVMKPLIATLLPSVGSQVRVDESAFDDPSSVLRRAARQNGARVFTLTSADAVVIRVRSVDCDHTGCPEWRLALQGIPAEP